MSHHDQEQPRNSQSRDGQHRLTSARASKGSSSKDVSKLGSPSRHCSQHRHRRHHPPDSLPVVSHPDCLVFVSTEKLIDELMGRSDSCVILRYVEHNDQTYDISLLRTPNLSTPDELVGMIEATLGTFGLPLDVEDNGDSYDYDDQE